MLLFSFVLPQCFAVERSVCFRLWKNVNNRWKQKSAYKNQLPNFIWLRHLMNACIWIAAAIYAWQLTRCWWWYHARATWLPMHWFRRLSGHQILMHRCWCLTYQCFFHGIRTLCFVQWMIWCMQNCRIITQRNQTVWYAFFKRWFLHGRHIVDVGDIFNVGRRLIFNFVATFFGWLQITDIIHMSAFVGYRKISNRIELLVKKTTKITWWHWMWKWCTKSMRFG